VTTHQFARPGSWSVFAVHTSRSVRLAQVTSVSAVSADQEQLAEALAKVLRQEGVDDRVQATVGIRQTRGVPDCSDGSVPDCQEGGIPDCRDAGVPDRRHLSGVLRRRQEVPRRQGSVPDLSKLEYARHVATIWNATISTR